MLRTNTPLVAVELMAASIWVGSLVCLAIVASSARRVLEARAQVIFFRAVGRRYGIVGTTALLVAIGCGLVLSWPPSSWSAVTEAAVALSGALVVMSVAAMGQARAMTVLRSRATAAPNDAVLTSALRRGRRLASSLRGVMALLTLSTLVLAAQAIAH
jgi:hypothetical protein